MTGPASAGAVSTGPASAGAAAHVFIDDLRAPEVAAEDEHHLSEVLRLRVGELVTAADGTGAWLLCHYLGARGLEPVGDVAEERAPDPEISVGFALLKGDRPEWVVQKLTELGVDRIVPLRTQRCIVRWEPTKAERQVTRLTKVARAAAMQSRRTRLPVIAPLADLSALRSDDGSLLAGAALAHPGGDPPALSRPTVLIGPEGGWTPDELAAVPHRVGLGPTQLRAETAAVAAATLLCGLRSSLVAGATTTLRGRNDASGGGAESEGDRRA